MGFDAKAKLIVGVKLTHNIDKNTRTKYNEDTGKPYQHVEEIPRFYIGEKVFSDVDMVFDDFEDNLHYADHENKDTYFVGFVIAETDYCNCGSGGKHCIDVGQFDRITAQQKCKKYLEENGFEIEPNMIKEYLIQYMSY